MSRRRIVVTSLQLPSTDDINHRIALKDGTLFARSGPDLDGEFVPIIHSDARDLDESKSSLDGMRSPMSTSAPSPLHNVASAVADHLSVLRSGGCRNVVRATRRNIGVCASDPGQVMAQVVETHERFGQFMASLVILLPDVDVAVLAEFEPRLERAKVVIALMQTFGEACAEIAAVSMRKHLSAAALARIAQHADGAIPREVRTAWEIRHGPSPPTAEAGASARAWMLARSPVVVFQEEDTRALRRGIPDDDPMTRLAKRMAAAVASLDGDLTKLAGAVGVQLPTAEGAARGAAEHKAAPPPSPSARSRVAALRTQIMANSDTIVAGVKYVLLLYWFLSTMHGDPWVPKTAADSSFPHLLSKILYGACVAMNVTGVLQTFVTGIIDAVVSAVQHVGTGVRSMAASLFDAGAMLLALPGASHIAKAFGFAVSGAGAIMRLVYGQILYALMDDMCLFVNTAMHGGADKPAAAFWSACQSMRALPTVIWRDTNVVRLFDWIGGKAGRTALLRGLPAAQQLLDTSLPITKELLRSRKAALVAARSLAGDGAAAAVRGASAAKALTAGAAASAAGSVVAGALIYKHHAGIVEEAKAHARRSGDSEEESLRAVAANRVARHQGDPAVSAGARAESRRASEAAAEATEAAAWQITSVKGAPSAHAGFDMLWRAYLRAEDSLSGRAHHMQARRGKWDRTELPIVSVVSASHATSAAGVHAVAHVLRQ